MADPDEIRLERRGSRWRKGSEAYTALAPPAYEEREIVLALGLENNWEAWQDDEVWGERIPPTPHFLREKLGTRFRESGEDVYEYTSNRQRVHFTLRVVRRKDAFKEALETEGAHVVYAGHSRFGRGACFGPDAEVAGRDERYRAEPGEHWGLGTENAKNGIFRMGFPVLAVPAKKIVAHGYSFAPVSVETGPKPAREDCHPDLRRAYGRLQSVGREELGGDVVELMRPPTGGAGPVPLPVWGYQGYYHGERVWHVLLHAGWEGTANAPMELGQTRMRCRVFCHFGCSSYKHFYPIVRERYGRERHGNEGYCYWTTDAAYAVSTSTFWIHNVLAYPRPNAFAPWEDSLHYARTKTNADLRASWVYASLSYRVL